MQLVVKLLGDTPMHRPTKLFFSSENSLRTCRHECCQTFQVLPPFLVSDSVCVCWKQSPKIVISRHNLSMKYFHSL